MELFEMVIFWMLTPHRQLSLLRRRSIQFTRTGLSLRESLSILTAPH
jgi:hypothetical protein